MNSSPRRALIERAYCACGAAPTALRTFTTLGNGRCDAWAYVRIYNTSACAILARVRIGKC